MSNAQSHRDISTFINEELVAQGSACQPPQPEPKPEPKIQRSDITILIDGSDSIKRRG